jgi:PAS domain S-box-containing protein
MFRNALSSFFEGTEDIIPSTTQLSRGLIGIQPNLAVAGVMSHAHSFFLCLWALAVALALCHVGFLEQVPPHPLDARRRRMLFLRYAFAVLTVIIAFFVRVGLMRLVGPLPPFITLYPAVLAAAVIAGGGPGILASALAAFIAYDFVLVPLRSITLVAENDTVSLVIFTVTNLSISILGESLHRIARAVAEQKEYAANALRHSEQRFHSMVEAIPQLAWAARADGFIHWYNQRWYDYTGTTALDMQGWGWQSVHDPQTLPAVLHLWKASIAQGVPFEMVFPLRAADGRFRAFLTRVQPLRDASGQVTQWVGTNTDIEELKRAEEVHARLAAIVESSDDAIISKQLDGTILSWNAGAERLLGYSAHEIIGRPISILVPPERAAEQADMIQRLLAGDDCEHIETERITRDRRTIDVSITISAVKDRDGKTIAISKIARDITDRKRAQRDLAAAMHAAEEARAVAENANAAKDYFIAVLSHELRTPLNPILVATSLLRDDPRLDADLREQFDVVCRNVELEARLIDDLLDMTRIQHGKMEMKLQPLDLNVLIRNVAEFFHTEAKAQSLRLTLECSPHPLWIEGDRIRLA